jgi:hypothetical protein
VTYLYKKCAINCIGHYTTTKEKTAIVCSYLYAVIVTSMSHSRLPTKSSTIQFATSPAVILPDFPRNFVRKYHLSRFTSAGIASFLLQTCNGKYRNYRIIIFF